MSLSVSHAKRVRRSRHLWAATRTLQVWEPMTQHITRASPIFFLHTIDVVVGLRMFRASPAVPPTWPPAAVFYIRTAVFGPVAPPVPHFPPDLGLNPSGEPRPTPVPRGALGDSGREKSGNRPALSARERANPTIWTQIPLSLPSLLCRRRHHPSPIRWPVA
jgi:hypothetical protein